MAANEITAVEIASMLVVLFIMVVVSHILSLFRMLSIGEMNIFAASRNSFTWSRATTDTQKMTGERTHALRPSYRTLPYKNPATSVHPYMKTATIVAVFLCLTGM
jgi:hypothetical protein